MAVQVQAAVQAQERVDSRAVGADQDIQRTGVGDHRDVDRVSEITDVTASDDVSGRADAAAHLERVNRIEVGVTIFAIGAINRNARDHAAVLLEHDGVAGSDLACGVGQSVVHAARFWPLNGIGDVGAAGNFEFDGSSAGCQGLGAHIHFAVHRFDRLLLASASPLSVVAWRTITSEQARLFPGASASWARRVPGAKPTTRP